jgi:putative ABC transport system permease protein
LNSRLTDEAEVNGNADAVIYLMFIAGFVLIIAWINYINLSTAKAMDRAKEVGLRKVLGSYRKQLIGQFLFESLFINMLALFIAVVIVLLVSSLFSQIGGTPSEYFIWTQPWFWYSFLVIPLIGAFGAGAYPALVLSSYRPITVLKGKFKTSAEGILLRRILVTIQFVASISLIIGTGIVFSQMDHMQNRNLGFNPNQIIVVQRPAIADTSFQVNVNRYNSFKTRLLSNPKINGVGISMSLPGKKLRFKTDIRLSRFSKEEAAPFSINLMDYDYAEMMEMELLTGRMFSKDFTNDPDTAVIVNETGMKALGFQDPSSIIGQTLVLDQWGWSPQVIGVFKDFHQESLQEKVGPIMTGVREHGLEYIMVKLNTADIATTLSSVEDQWNKSFVGNPFDYFFLDEYFNSYYESERQFKRLFTIFTFLAIFVGSLGLFGLTLFSAAQRSKEIGIRKVLGASVQKIVMLLARDVIALILISNAIAWPLTYYFMGEWLNNYPYQTEINLLLFVGAGGSVILVTLLTVGIQTLKSAKGNPVEALKYE